MLKIDLSSKEPIVEQIYRGIRHEIASGRIASGHSLPTVRQLAGDLGISLNTVARSYRMLEADGLVIPIRGRGTVVVDKEQTDSQAEKGETVLIVEMRNLLTSAKLAGWSKMQFESILEAEAKSFWKVEESRDV